MADATKVMGYILRILSVILIIYSCVNAVTGAAVVGVGVYILIDLSPQHGGNLIMVFSNLQGPNSKSGMHKAAVSMIVCGTFIMLHGTTASISLCKRKFKSPYGFITLLIISIICGMVTGFYAVRFQQEVDANLEPYLYQTISEEFASGNGSVNIYTSSWNYVQKEYSCCGIYNGTDWNLAENWNRSLAVVDSKGEQITVTLTIPISCCRLLTKSQIITKWFGQILSRPAKENLKDSDETLVFDQPCIQEATIYNSYIGEGCMTSISDHLLEYNAAIVSGALVIVLMQIAGVLLTIIFYKLAKDQESKGNNWYKASSEQRAISSNKKLFPREVRKRYPYFDDDLEDHWQTAV